MIHHVCTLVCATTALVLAVASQLTAKMSRSKSLSCCKPAAISILTESSKAVNSQFSCASCLFCDIKLGNNREYWDMLSFFVGRIKNVSLPMLAQTRHVHST